MRGAATPIALDEAWLRLAQVEALAAQGQARFHARPQGRRPGDDGLAGRKRRAAGDGVCGAYGPLEMAGVPEAFNYGWAPEDGVYTLVVANPGDAAAGFVLRVVVTPAPLPAQKI